jgi:hypothetical protein
MIPAWTRRHLDAGVPGTLADTHARKIDRHAAADDQIDRVHVPNSHLGCHCDCHAVRRHRLKLAVKLDRIKPEEWQGVSQLGHGHVDQFALTQRLYPHRQLRLIRIGLEHVGTLPRGQRRELRGAGCGGGCFQLPRRTYAKARLPSTSERVLWRARNAFAAASRNGSARSG